MNAVLYNSIPGKLINGTLFYSFEYYAFLKTYDSSIKYYILGVTDQQLNQIKGIFAEKYDLEPLWLDDIVTISRTDFARENIGNLLVLDVQSYERIRYFTHACKHVRIYSNESHPHLGTKPNHTFYGWYSSYQKFDVKTRLKFFKEIHKVFTTKGDKIFVSSLNGDNNLIVSILGLNKEDLYVKMLNKHNPNLFASIKEIIYYHTGFVDTNNRAVVEAYIHNIPLTVHLNGYDGDSIKERADALANGQLDSFLLTADDLLIKDFVTGL